MADPIRWLALGYSVPVNPSKNRVYVWRKLKEYGAEYFKQGVALLPYNRQSYTKFKYLSAKILEMGGEASIVEMKFWTPRTKERSFHVFARRRWRNCLSSSRTVHRCCPSSKMVGQSLPRISPNR